MSVIQPFNVARYGGFVAGFALKGPLLGWVVVWIELIAINILSRPLAGEIGTSMEEAGAGLVALFVLSLVFAYLLGAVPAAVTGLICYPVSVLAMPVWCWVLACATVGGAVTTLGVFAIGMSVRLEPAFVALVLAPGTGASAGCGYLARRARWAVLPPRSI